MGAGGADGQQPVPVRSRAGAPPTGLDAEEVVEQRDDEIVVQVAPVPVTEPEGHHGQPAGLVTAKQLDARVACTTAKDAVPEPLFARGDQVRPDGLLEAEPQAGPD